MENKLNKLGKKSHELCRDFRGVCNLIKAPSTTDKYGNTSHIRFLLRAKFYKRKLIVRDGVIWCTNYKNLGGKIETIPFSNLPKSLHAKWEGKTLFNK